MVQCSGLIDAEVINVYLTYEELRRIVSVLQNGERLKDYLNGKIMEYERRMKDAKDTNRTS